MNGLEIIADQIKGNVELWNGAELAHQDTIDIGRERHRQKFADDGSRKLGEECSEQIAKLLLRRLRELRDRAREQAAPSAVDLPQLVRPEMFITRDVVGVAAPEPIIIDGRAEGRWKLYLAWRDGQREVRDLARCIELRAGARVYVDPYPSAPTASATIGWSIASRRSWPKENDEPRIADVFKRLCNAITRFAEFHKSESAGVTATLSLWTIFTYIFSVWPAVPYLYVGGPAGSGKTRIFEILSRMIFRPVASSNITAAALFRTLHDRGGTLLLDEAERLNEGTPDVAELRSVLLCGYKRDGRATRLEPQSDNTFKTVEFDVFGPKAIACIGGVRGPLRTRCIPIMMFRAGPKCPKPRLRIDADVSLWQQLRDDLHALSLGKLGFAAHDLAADADACKLSGRDFELWQPLMSLARLIESDGVPGLLDVMQQHAARVMERSQDDETPAGDELVLKTLAETLRDRGRLDAPAPAELLKIARDRDPETCEGWNARSISNILKRYGIVTNVVASRRAFRNVTDDDLAEIQTNYGIDLGI